MVPSINTVEDLDNLPGGSVIVADLSVARKSAFGEWYVSGRVEPISPERLLLSDDNWFLVL